ncbi:MAG: hypothetical protein M3P18_06300 [Actinomycetota bacterium]|nr:hypothetical protein [Actinomycetota bacterium]
MPQETSLLDVIEILGMLVVAGVTYGWVFRRIVGWPPPTPTPPGSKRILRLVTPPISATEDSEVRSSRQAA